MLYHTEVLIFQIIKLYCYTTGEYKVPLNLLEQAFYELQGIMNKGKNLEDNKIFEVELDSLLEILSDIEFNDEELIVYGEIEDLENTLKEQLEPLFYDKLLSYYSFNYAVIKALKIEVLPEEAEPIIEKNKATMALFIKLAQEELNNIPSVETLAQLNEAYDELIEMFETLSKEMLTKIKVYCAILNKDRFQNSKKENVDNTWYIVLFSNASSQMERIIYDRVDFWSFMCEEEENESDEEPIMSDVDYFLKTFFNNLCTYLEQYPNTFGKEALTIKKYLLLSLPELDEIRDIYLETKDIGNTKIETYYPFTKEHFNSLLETVFECIQNLKKTNIKLENEFVFSKAILSAIFIKTFLDLSVNEEAKRKVIVVLTSLGFYKAPGYEGISNIIDNLIFDSSKERTW